MSDKFEVEFSDVEGTKFRPFRVHAIRMPNGAIYDAVNGWRGDCPPPDEPMIKVEEKMDDGYVPALKELLFHISFDRADNTCKVTVAGAISDWFDDADSTRYVTVDDQDFGFELSVDNQ